MTPNELAAHIQKDMAAKAAREANRLDPIEVSGADIEDMVSGYLEAQLWAGLDWSKADDENEPEPYDANYSVEDISPEYVASVRGEIEDMVSEHPLAVRMYLNQRCPMGVGTPSEYFGHDFYLTREGHGVGFWDRGLGDLGEYLTKIAKGYGSATELYDNGTGTLTA